MDSLFSERFTPLMSCRRVTSRGAGFTWSYHSSYFRLTKHLEIYVLIEKNDSTVICLLGFTLSLYVCIFSFGEKLWWKKRHDWNWMDNSHYFTMKWWLPKKGKRRTERTCWSRSVPFGWKRNRLTDENWTFYRLWTRECAMEGLFLLFYCKGGQISQKLVYI